MIPLLQGRALAGGQIIVRTLVSSYIALLYLIFRDVPARGQNNPKPRYYAETVKTSRDDRFFVYTAQNFTYF